MSWQATAWVSTVEAGGPSGKLLLYALANYADEHGRCWPSDSRLMADTEMGERTIRDWKRKLEDAGLLTVARRRGIGGTYQADEIRLAMASSTAKKAAPADAQPPANAAGGEDATTGECRRDHRQLTPPPPASDSNPPAPPYKAEPSKEPSEEPIERERESEGEEVASDDPAKFERRVKRIADDTSWPGWVGSSTAWAVRQFAGLTDAGRAEAERRAPAFLAFCRSQKTAPVALGVYFRDQKWTDLPAVAEKPERTDDYAPPFGPVWGGIRMRVMMTTPPVDGPKPGAFMAGQLARDDEQGRRARLTRQATYGWPIVSRMHEDALSRRGVSVTVALAERLKPLMEPVPVGSELWGLWRDEHEARGWPWLPDPGLQRVAYFPAGGPVGLETFVQAISDEGNDHDGGAQQAAE